MRSADSGTWRAGCTRVRRAGLTAGRKDTSGNKLSVFRSNEPIGSFDVQFSVLEVSHVEHLDGRMEELIAIHKGLQHNGSRKTLVVHDLGGMGKTQLALAYAERHTKANSAVFYINSKAKIC